VKDVSGRHDVKLALVTTGIADAVRDAELVLCPAPAFAQAESQDSLRRICVRVRWSSCRRRRSAR